MALTLGSSNMRARARMGVPLVLLMLLTGPAAAALDLSPGVPAAPLGEEVVLIAPEAWDASSWADIRGDGFEPLRQLSAHELLVWAWPMAVVPDGYEVGEVPLESGVRGPSTSMVRVVFEPRLPAAVQSDLIERLSPRTVELAGAQSTLSTVVEVELAPDFATGVVTWPGVLWVESVLATEARNDISASIMQHGGMEGHPAWAWGLDGSGVLLAMADSGLDADHACFRHGLNETGEAGENHRKVEAINTTLDDWDNASHTNYRHGTHIAGTLVCRLITEVGQAPGEGTSMAHGARILVQDVVNESGWVEPTVDWMLAEALAEGALIHSDSWGDASEAYTHRAATLDVWHREVPWSQAFFAPGNSASRFYEPANARNVISVGGSLRDDSGNLWASSSHGPSEEGLRGNFVVAPAQGIVSARADGLRDSLNDDMRTSSGTSMSTPMAASFAGVVQQMVEDGWIRGAGESVDAVPITDLRPSWADANLSSDGDVLLGEGFTPSAALLRALIAMSADNLSGASQGGEVVGDSPDPIAGWGRPNLSRLFDFAAIDGALEVVDGPITINGAHNIWVHDSFRMSDANRLAWIEAALDSAGERPLDQMTAHAWNGSQAAGPFLAAGENASFELKLLPGEDLEVFLSFSPRPFTSPVDDLDLRIHLPDGRTLASNDSLEGTEAIRIPASELDGIEFVEIEVVGLSVGVGNLSDALGHDGDHIGFALAVKGVDRDHQPAAPPAIEEPYFEVDGVHTLRWIQGNREEVHYDRKVVRINGSNMSGHPVLVTDLATPVNITLHVHTTGNFSTGTFTQSSRVITYYYCNEEDGRDAEWYSENGTVTIEIEDYRGSGLFFHTCDDQILWTYGDWVLHEDEIAFGSLHESWRNSVEGFDRMAAYRGWLNISKSVHPWWGELGAKPGAPTNLTCEFAGHGLDPIDCTTVWNEGLWFNSHSRGGQIHMYLTWDYGGELQTLRTPVAIFVGDAMVALDGGRSGSIATSPASIRLENLPDGGQRATVTMFSWSPQGGWPVRITQGDSVEVFVMEANEELHFDLERCELIRVETPQELDPWTIDWTQTEPNIRITASNSDGELVQTHAIQLQPYTFDANFLGSMTDGDSQIQFSDENLLASVAIPDEDCVASERGWAAAGSHWHIAILFGGLGGVSTWVLFLVLFLVWPRKEAAQPPENGVLPPFVSGEESE